jgi:molecular chaperone HscA
MQVRALVEAQTEAKQIIDTTTVFITKNKEYLLEEEIAQTKNAISELSELIEKGNKDEIHTAIEKLNDLSRPYAERLMNEAIGKAMKGKTI